MASELLKNRALIQKLKEPDVPIINFDLANSALDYSIESTEEELLPKQKPQELLDIQENVRIKRKQDTMNKARPFLMDESIDFIEREEFKVGTYPKTNPEDLQRLREYLTNLPDDAKVLANPLQKQFNIDRKTIGLIVEREFPNLNLLKAGAAQAENVAKFNKLRREAMEANYEKILKEGYLDDYKLKIQTPSGSVFNKGLSNAQLAKKYFPDVSEGTGVARIEKLNRYIRKKYPDLIYPPGEPTSVSAKRRRERILEQRKFLSEEEKKIRKKQMSQKKILNKYFSNNPEEILNKKEIKKLIDVKLKDGKLDFTPRYKTDKEYIDLAKKGLLFDEYDITPVRLEKRNIEFPINKNITPAKFNQGFIKQVDAYFKKTKGSTDPDVIANKKIISDFLNSYGLTLETRGERIGSPTKLPAIDKETGELPNIKNTLNKLEIGDLSTSENVGLKTKDIEKAVKKLSGQKKLTALQQLASSKNVGFDPVLATKAGFEEFVKPAAKMGARGAAGLADLAISAGKGGTGLAIGALLEADPIITGMSEGKDFGQTARDTFIGSAIDAIPGVNLGSLNEDLIKLADTEEQRVAVQNLIDYQKDYDRFTKDLRAFKSYQGLDQNSLDELGFTASDLVNMESQLAKRYRDIQDRAPKVYNPDVLGLVEGLARKEAERRKENLEGIQGLIFGRTTDPDFVDKKTDQIMRAATGQSAATDSYTDAYQSLPQPELSPEELDDIYEMGGIMGAAEGGRIGFAEGPMDPKRRLFLKLMTGIMTLPFIPKFMKQADVAKPIVKVAGSSTKMPDWFPDMINKVMFGGTGKKIDADLTIYEPKELPGISIGRYDDGRVFVEGQNEYGKKYMIEYEPPGFELIDEKTGKAVKTKGEFIAQEEVPVNIDPDGNVDFDVEVLNDLDNIMGPDTRRMEEFTTGKVTKTVKDFTGDTGIKRGEYQVGAAEARFEQAADEAAERLADEADEAAGALDEID